MIPKPGTARFREEIEAIPEVAELLAGDPIQRAFISDLITAHVADVNEQMDANLGDLENWKPTGILGSRS
jgi:hypothetical protein